MMGRKQSPVRVSKIFTHILKCLKEGLHSHMLKWIGELEFEVILKDRRNSSWTSRDNSLLEELDKLFSRNYKTSTFKGSRTRFNARMDFLCRNRLKETTQQSNTRTSIKRRSFKILPQNCGKECAGVSNLDINFLEDQPHSDQNPVKYSVSDQDKFSKASHSSRLSEYQDFNSGRSTSEILFQSNTAKNEDNNEIKKTNSTIKKQVLALVLQRKKSDNVCFDILPANSGIYEVTIQGNGNNYVPMATLSPINKKINEVSIQGNGNNYVPMATLSPINKKINEFSIQGNGNNGHFMANAKSNEHSMANAKSNEYSMTNAFSNEHSRANNKSIEHSVANAKSNEHSTADAQSNEPSTATLSPFNKEINVQGNENNYVAICSQFPIIKEMEVVTIQGNGNNYVSISDQFPIPKEMEVVTIQRYGNKSVSNGNLLRTENKIEELTEQENKNNYLNANLYVVNKVMEAIPAQCSKIKEANATEVESISFIQPITHSSVEKEEFSESLMQSTTFLPILLFADDYVSHESNMSQPLGAENNEPIILKCNYLETSENECFDHSIKRRDLVNMMHEESQLEEPMNLKYFNLDENTDMSMDYEEFMNFNDIEMDDDFTIQLSSKLEAPDNYNSTHTQASRDSESLEMFHNLFPDFQ